MIYSLYRADAWTVEDFRRAVESEAAIYFDRPGRGDPRPLDELRVVSRSRWGWGWIWEIVIEEHRRRRRERCSA